MPARRVLLPVALLASLSVFALNGATADGPGSPERTDKPKVYTLSVIGDQPYTTEQFDSFPARIREINADTQVRTVMHLGDIKSGSTVCSDGYYAQIRADFDLFADPFVYTPGDNEWTDFHRPDDGST